MLLISQAKSVLFPLDLVSWLAKDLQCHQKCTKIFFWVMAAAEDFKNSHRCSGRKETPHQKPCKRKAGNKIKLSLSAWLIIAGDDVSCGCYSYNSCCVALLPFRWKGNSAQHSESTALAAALFFQTALFPVLVTNCSNCYVDYYG